MNIQNFQTTKSLFWHFLDLQFTNVLRKDKPIIVILKIRLFALY